MSAAPIGVFDSGLGGLSVLRALRAELPGEHFIYFADTGNAPYGERSDEFIAARSLEIARHLHDDHGAKALVVACNTATASAIHLIRQTYAHLPVVGVEPGLKPAIAASQTKRIGVLATRGTLASAKFRALHLSLANQASFQLQPCDGLADAIERGDTALVDELSERYVDALGTVGSGPGEVDTLVLGCTHYPLVMERFAQLAGSQVRLIETGAPVARHTRFVLEGAGLLAQQGPGELSLLTTGDLVALQAAAARWLARPQGS
ncbi:glutamate racemase [Caenimonas koreensis]|uniref:glutamate racemase n=1 Tax=Caenimonas koreensis TaxID=367474 RepID=UPI00378508D3